MSSLVYHLSDMCNIIPVEELDIGNAGPTTVHLNIKQHSVTEMGRRCKK